MARWMTCNTSESSCGWGGEQMPERAALYSFGLGFDHPIELDHLFVADFFADRSERMDGDPVSTIELELRSQVNPWPVFAIGSGTRFGDDREAADSKANLGCQMGF